MADQAAGKPAIVPRGKSAAQLERIAATGMERSVDVHCHCLPTIDDGPVDLDRALLLCQALVDDGITSVIATPHQLGKYDLENSSSQIHQRLHELDEALYQAQIPLEVVPGGEVRIDERMLELISSGAVCTAGNLGVHLLLELPTNLFCEPRSLIAQLAAQDVQCILTHPERHSYLEGRPEHAASWIRAGAVIQLTAGSLLGDYGRHAFDYAWRLLNRGLVSLVASDAHDHVRRPPRMTAALEAIDRSLGSEVAKTVCLANPIRVWRGEFIPSPFA